MPNKKVKEEILKGLYYGEFDISEEDIYEIEGYIDCMKKATKAREDFESILNQEQKELLEKYLNIHTELEGVMQFHYFCRGWEMGIKFKTATE